MDCRCDIYIYIYPSVVLLLLDSRCGAQVHKMGFFASAGPVEIFVSNHQMPEDMSFSHANEPSYIRYEIESNNQGGGS